MRPLGTPIFKGSLLAHSGDELGLVPMLEARRGAPFPSGSSFLKGPDMPTKRQNRAAVELAKALTEHQKVKKESSPANAKSLRRVMSARAERAAAKRDAERKGRNQTTDKNNGN